jgi:hypothetical protein
MPDTTIVKGVSIGDTIECTVTKTPTHTAEIKTIQRLMRRDPANSKALRGGQMARERRKYVRIRAGRPWQVRERCGKIVRAEAGHTWTMKFIPQLKDDLKAVQAFIEVKKV